MIANMKVGVAHIFMAFHLHKFHNFTLEQIIAILYLVTPEKVRFILLLIRAKDCKKGFSQSVGA